MRKTIRYLFSECIREQFAMIRICNFIVMCFNRQIVVSIEMYELTMDKCWQDRQ